MNKVILIGNVGKDPETKVFDSENNNQVSRFPLATNEKRKQNDTYVDATTWHNCVVFGKQSQTVEKYVAKGVKLAVEGKIENRSWEDQEGNTRYITEIICSRVEFVGKHEGQPNERKEATPVVESNGTPAEEIDDDLPF